MQFRDNGALTGIAAFGVFLLTVILTISRAIGASFASVCSSAGTIVAIVVLLALAYRIFNEFGLQLLAAFPVFAWPAIWPVLTSIANGGSDEENSFHP